MAAGENAAEKLKGVFHQGSEATESARQNTNSFVDNLMSGSKADSADTSAGQKAYTTGAVDGEKTLTGGHEDVKGEHGFNQDAEAAGGLAKEGAGAAVEGAGNMAEKAKRKAYGT
ncbi:hypothetical protein Q7P37_010566 [Cladosporium fusiforme]